MFFIFKFDIRVSRPLAEMGRNQLPTFIQEKLKVLKFPFDDIFMSSIASMEEPFQKCVLWLEEEKIRFYPKSDREGLRNTSDRLLWNAALLKYVRDLGNLDIGEITEDSTQVFRLNVLDFLTSEAIREVYLDYVQEEQIANADNNEKSNDDEIFLDHGKTSNLINNLNSILENIEIPPLCPETANENEILSVLKLIKMRILEDEDSEFEKINVDLPAETSNGNDSKVVNNVGSVVRLLHCQELRKLQQYINQSIGSLQQLMSDPKTDTKLGKVGV